MLSERYGMSRSVMPIWHNVHRTYGAALLADEAPADCRPRQILGQGLQPDIDHASVALTARTLDVAGYVAVREAFRRAAPGGYWSVRRDCGRCKAIGDDSAAGDVMQIINPLGGGTLPCYIAW
jgi:hypothetical protein